MHSAPKQLLIGHIVRFHRLQIQTYNGRPQGFVNGSTGVSYAILDGFSSSMVPVYAIVLEDDQTRSGIDHTISAS
jgi:hypothetical protein